MRIYLFIIALFFEGCASINAPVPKPELHVIGVYEGYDKAKQVNTHSPALSMRGSYAGKGRNVVAFKQTATIDNKTNTPITNKYDKDFKEVIVNVSKTDAPLILALSAYDKTKWRVNVKEKVKIERVILSG